MAPVKRGPQKAAGHHARPITPEPVTAPVATRAWCVRDPRKLPDNSAASRPRRFKPPPRPKKFIAIRTECAASTTASMPGFEGERWAPAVQALVFGCAVIGRTADWRIDREVIFYPDDLPESGVVALCKYVQELTWRLGARPRKEGDPEPDLIWRDEARLGTPVNGRSIKVQLLPLSEFLKLFYCVAYEDRSLIIGYDLPRELTRLAAFWREIKKGEKVGGWKLALWTYLDPNTGKQSPSAGWRPQIILKRVAPNVTFIEFTGRRGSRYRGEFLDLSNLAHALTGRHWMLAEALGCFPGERIDKHVEHGRITPDCIDYRRREAYAIVRLAETLVDLFDRLHPVSRRRLGGFVNETRLFSPGGLGRAYLKAAGFSPPAVRQDRLGACAAASYGGWSEVQVRGRPPGACRFPAAVSNGVSSARATGASSGRAARICRGYCGHKGIREGLHPRGAVSSGDIPKAERSLLAEARRRAFAGAGGIQGKRQFGRSSIYHGAGATLQR